MPFTVSHLNQLISVVSVQFCWLLLLLLLLLLCAVSGSGSGNGCGISHGQKKMWPVAAAAACRSSTCVNFASLTERDVTAEGRRGRAYRQLKQLSNKCCHQSSSSSPTSTSTSTSTSLVFRSVNSKGCSSCCCCWQAAP